MTIRPRTLLLIAIFIAGSGLILHTMYGVLSPHLQQSLEGEARHRREEIAERVKTDPEFRARREQLIAEFGTSLQRVDDELPWFCVGPIEDVYTTFAKASSKDQGELSAWLFMTGGSLLIWLLFLRRLFRPRQGIDPNILGSAGFASGKDFESALKSAHGLGAVPLGKIAGKLRSYPSDKHVLMVVANRSGKGVSYILPSLLSYQGSVFVIDPKAENASITARYRSGLGKVCVIDPWQKAIGEAAGCRVSFNPLRSIIERGEDRLYADVQALAGAMIIASGDQKNDHWNQSAEQLLTAIMAHVCTSPNIEQRDLVTVRALLMHEFFPQIDQETGEGDGTSTLERMMANSACNRSIAGEAQALWNTPDNERGGILSTARKQTQFLDEPFLASSLRDNPDQVNFNDWKAGVMSCYLCIPAPYIQRYARWLRVVITAALDSMIRDLSPPKLPVQFILDELAFLGRLPVIEEAFGLAAGYGVQLWAIFQDVGQMRDLYKERAPTFWNNAGVRIAFAAHDHETAEYVSKHLGTTTVTTMGQSLGGSGESLTGQTLNQQARPLLNPDEVSRAYARETGKALVFLDAIHPLEVERVLHYRDEPFKSRADKIG